MARLGSAEHNLGSETSLNRLVLGVEDLIEATSAVALSDYANVATRQMAQGLKDQIDAVSEQLSFPAGVQNKSAALGYNIFSIGAIRPTLAAMEQGMTAAEARAFVRTLQIFPFSAPAQIKSALGTFGAGLDSIDPVVRWGEACLELSDRLGKPLLAGDIFRELGTARPHPIVRPAKQQWLATTAQLSPGRMLTPNAQAFVAHAEASDFPVTHDIHGGSTRRLGYTAAATGAAVAGSLIHPGSAAAQTPDYSIVGNATEYTAAATALPNLGDATSVAAPFHASMLQAPLAPSGTAPKQINHLAVPMASTAPEVPVAPADVSGVIAAGDTVSHDMSFTTSREALVDPPTKPTPKTEIPFLPESDPSKPLDPRVVRTAIAQAYGADPEALASVDAAATPATVGSDSETQSLNEQTSTQQSPENTTTPETVAESKPLVQVNVLLANQIRSLLDLRATSASSASSEAFPVRAEQLNLSASALSGFLDDSLYFKTMSAADKKALTSVQDSGDELVSFHTKEMLDRLKSQAYGALDKIDDDTAKLLARALAAGDIETMDLTARAELDQNFADYQAKKAAEEAAKKAAEEKARQEAAASDAAEAPTGLHKLTDKEAEAIALDRLAQSGPNWKNRALVLEGMIDGLDITPDEASGFVGGFVIESGGKDLKPSRKQYGGGPGRGFGQWGSYVDAYDRFGFNKQPNGQYKYGTLRWYSDLKGLDWDTLEAQIGFVVWELKNTENNALVQLKKTDTVYEAAVVAMDDYERPASRDVTLRAQAAEDTLKGFRAMVDTVKRENQKAIDAAAKERVKQQMLETNASYPQLWSGLNNESKQKINAILNEIPHRDSQLKAYYQPRMIEKLKNAGYKNGELPNSILKNADSTNKHPMYFEAAKAFIAMDKAFHEETGKHLTIFSGNGAAYRTLQIQKNIKADNPGSKSTQVAVPGTSRHGWGLAVDIAKTSSYDSLRYKWLEKNAYKFGFFHGYEHMQGNPDASSYPEPWHWNWGGLGPVRVVLN